MTTDRQPFPLGLNQPLFDAFLHQPPCANMSIAVTNAVKGVVSV
ncbi:MAG: hypothetical protein P8H24_07115 [Methylophilaceae bacterium]|nr:hypothetical protein [Methylophilaceae bacterium]MDG1821572.1 hypothetical protein [Methylophilaceae bacterium]